MEFQFSILTCYYSNTVFTQDFTLQQGFLLSSQCLFFGSNICACFFGSKPNEEEAAACGHILKPASVPAACGQKKEIGCYITHTAKAFGDNDVNIFHCDNFESVQALMEHLFGNVQHPELSSEHNPRASTERSWNIVHVGGLFNVKVSITYVVMCSLNKDCNVVFRCLLLGLRVALESELTSAAPLLDAPRPM